MDTNDILATTSNTIYRFIGQKNGGDCLLLYMRYVVQSRLQGTANTFSNDEFMRKAMGWGKERFSKAKKYLVDSNTIELITRRDDKGIINSHYVRVKYDISSIEPISPQPSFPSDWTYPPSGKQEANTIVENINTIVEKENAIVENDISSLDLSFMEETKKPLVKKTRNNDIDIIINSFKESLSSKGYIYSNNKERMFGMHLSKNSEWKKLVEENGGDVSALIKNIMEWSFSDTFWNAKITSIATFYYKWGVLVNQMKQRSAYVPLNAKRDEARKAATLAYLENL